MKLLFDDRALADLEAIYHWIGKDNPMAAKAVVERVFASVEHLASFPQMGSIVRSIALWRAVDTVEKARGG